MECFCTFSGTEVVRIREANFEGEVESAQWTRGRYRIEGIMLLQRMISLLCQIRWGAVGKGSKEQRENCILKLR